MADGSQIARLIPVSGISNSTEAETRATSALLSVLTIVRDLSVVMFSPLGASTARKAAVEAFIETQFKLNDGTVLRPDGVVQITWGASVWKALIEVKTGNNLLQSDQVNSYLNLARQQGVNAVVTISNEIGVGAEHPCDGVRITPKGKVGLAHFSWTEILSHAVRAKVHRGVNDPEQAWILGELIRYLEHSNSGAMDFTDMGTNWTTVRDAARAGTLQKADPELRDIVHRWDQLIRFVGLRLGASTGADVQPVVPRAHAHPKIRFGHLADELSTKGVLDAMIRVPGAAGDINVVADLRARQISSSTIIAAPTDRHDRAQTTWLMRQLGRDVPADLMVEAWQRRARQPLSATVAQAREDRKLLLDSDHTDIMRFRLIYRAEMGQGRKDTGRSPGFIRSVTDLVDTFYESVLQQIVPWTVPPPQTKATIRPKEPVDEPIKDADDLDEAIIAARASAHDDVEDSASAATTREKALDTLERTTPGDDLVEAPIAMAEQASAPLDG